MDDDCESSGGKATGRMKHVCPHCGCRFSPCPRVRNQEFCGKKECRRAWKRTWQRNKLKRDAEYRGNQKAAQEAWREKHRGYWKSYRERNPAQAEANRVRQRERARELRRHRSAASKSIFAPFAKMDSITPGNPDPKGPLPGLYRLSPVGGEFAKMDSIIVEIRSISGSP